MCGRVKTNLALYCAGMFEASMADTAAPAPRRISRVEPSHNPPRGVYGHRVRHNSSGKQSSDGDSEGDDDDDEEEVSEVMKATEI